LNKSYFQWSEKQADKYYNLLIEKIDFLAKNVFAGHKIDFIMDGYRCYTAMQHLIFYTISPEKTINIIRILHRKMDIPNRLLEE
jgi:toxin ParE1/3/4